MHTVKVTDIEGRILDEEEKNRAVDKIRTYTDERVSRLPAIINFTGSRMRTKKVLEDAQILGSQIDQYPLQKNIDLLTGYVYFINNLIAIDPAFFELYNLNGKNMLAALYTSEELCAKHRERDDKTLLTSLVNLEYLLAGTPQGKKIIKENVNFPIKRDVSLGDLKEYVHYTHGKAREYIRKALSALDASRNELGSDVADVYAGEIGMWLASSYRREAYFIIQSSSYSGIFQAIETANRNLFNSDMLQSFSEKLALAKDHDELLSISTANAAMVAGVREVHDPFVLNMAAIGTYQKIFKECTLLDEEFFAEKVINYANCFKMYKNISFCRAKAIECFEYARKIVGDLPEIQAGIAFLNE